MPLHTNARYSSLFAQRSQVMTDTGAVFETLAARRRRYVLYYLLEADDAVSLSDLTALIAAVERGRPVGSVSTDRRRRVAVDLECTHLPMLEDRGFVEYDPESTLVTLAAGFERATPYLELASQYERPPTVPARGEA